MKNKMENPAASGDAAKVHLFTSGLGDCGKTDSIPDGSFEQVSRIIGRRFRLTDVTARTVCRLAGIGGRGA